MQELRKGSIVEKGKIVFFAYLIGLIIGFYVLPQILGDVGVIIMIILTIVLGFIFSMLGGGV